MASKAFSQLTAQTAGSHLPFPGLEPRRRAYTPTSQLGALSNVGGRPKLSPRLLPFASTTHLYIDYYSLTDPGGMEG